MFITPLGYCDADASMFFADIIGLRSTGILALVAIASALYFRARARRARRPESLAEGTAAVHGRVESAEPSSPSPPIRVRWTGPFVPRVDLSPLWLVHSSGARVRVNPPRDVQWTEGLDDASPLISQAFENGVLRENRSVTLYGSLRTVADPTATARGYRESGQIWELLPDPSGTMLFSLRTPDAPAARLASYHARWAVGLLVAVLALQFTVFLQFNALRAFGTLLDLPLVSAAPDDQMQGGTPTQRDRVVADYTTPDGRVLRLQAEARGWDYETNRVGRTPWLVVPAFPEAFQQIGGAPTVPWGGAAVAGVGFVLALFAYGFGTLGRLRWYRAQRTLLRPWAPDRNDAP